jgi:hypothetical protein
MTVSSVGEPVAQLPLEITLIEKPPLFEERSFHPADEILDAAFGQSRRLRLMTRLRSESSASPIHFIR